MACGQDSPSSSLLDSFRQGDYETAERLLVETKGEMSHGQWSLERGYILRERGEIGASTEAFNQAAESVHRLQRPNLALEIQLNLAFNAFTQKNIPQLQQAIEKAKLIEENSPWIDFYTGLQNFLENDFVTARELLSSTQEKLPLSPWMKQMIQLHLTEEWFALTLARLDMEVGDFIAARQNLQQLLSDAKGEIRNEILYNIALSYVQEAEEKSPLTAVPFYKLALSNLDELPPNYSSYKSEEKKLISQFEAAIATLLKEKNYQEIPFYLDSLSKLNAKKASEKSSQLVVQELKLQISEQDWDDAEKIGMIIPKLAEVTLDAHVHKIVNHLLEKGFSGLAQDNLTQAGHYFKLALTVSGRSQEVLQEIDQAILEKMMQLVKHDDTQLNSTRELVQFWRGLSGNHEELMTILDQLLDRAEMLWFKGEPEKGVAILNLILSQPDLANSNRVKELVGERIERLYATSRKNTELNRILDLLTFVEKFQLDGLELPVNEELIVEHASGLMQAGRDNEALKFAKWVGFLNPENTKAKSIIGLVLYKQARYSQAIAYLDPPQDEEELKAFAISRMISVDPDEGVQLLKEMAHEVFLDEEVHLRVGLGLLARGDIAEGAQWLKNVSNDNPEAQIGLCYAAFSGQHYEKALREWQKLPDAYKYMIPVKGLAVQTLLEMHQPEEAEKLLFSNTKHVQANQVDQLSFPYQEFQKQALEPFHSNNLIGKFLLDVKHSPEFALEHLRNIEDPTPESQLLIGQALFTLNRLDESLPYLEVAAQESQVKEVTDEAIPLLIQSLESQNRQLDALKWYRKFYNQNPQTTDLRDDFANLLNEFYLYEEALEQYWILIDSGELSIDAYAPYIQSLIYSQDLQLAFEEAQRLLETNPPLEIQLAIARSMAIAHRYKEVQPLISSVPKPQELTDDQVEALLALHIQTTAYGKAASLIQKREESLKESLEGLVLLSTYYERMSNRKKAVEILKEAVHKYPHDQEIALHLDKLSGNLTSSEERVMQFYQKYRDEKENLSLTLDMMRTIVAFADLAEGGEPDSPIVNRVENYLHKARHAAEKLVKDFGHLPEVTYLYGKITEGLGKRDEAIDWLEKSIEISPTYSPPRLAMADLYIDQNMSSLAVEQLMQVVNYHPDMSDTWGRLGDIYQNEGYFYESAGYYQNAIKIKPNSVAFHISLGEVLIHMQNPEEAKPVLEKAVSLAPKNIKALQLLLECLYDDLFFINSEDPKALAREQKEVFQKLYAVDAEAARNLLSELNKRKEELLKYDFPPNYTNRKEFSDEKK